MAGQVQLGGRTHRGLVVRFGDELHRPWTRQSAGIEGLLRHLEAAGFEGAPRWRRTDGARDVVSWVEGDTHDDEPPAWATSPEGLAQVAALLRTFHDAGRGFAPPEGWAPRLPAPAGLEGAQPCHGDLGHGNVVYRGRTPVALIDFDFAVLADPLLDVAALASQWPPLPTTPKEAFGRRPAEVLESVARIADAYGLDAHQRHRLPHAMAVVELEAIRFVERQAVAGDALAKAALFGGELERRRFRLTWLHSLTPALGARLERAAV